MVREYIAHWRERAMPEIRPFRPSGARLIPSRPPCEACGGGSDHSTVDFDNAG